MSNAAGRWRAFSRRELPKQYHTIIYFFVANLLLLHYLCRQKVNQHETIGKITAAGHAIGQHVTISGHLR